MTAPSTARAVAVASLAALSGTASASMPACSAPTFANALLARILKAALTLPLALHLALVELQKVCAVDFRSDPKCAQELFCILLTFCIDLCLPTYGSQVNLLITTTSTIRSISRTATPPLRRRPRRARMHVRCLTKTIRKGIHKHLD